MSVEAMTWVFKNSPYRLGARLVHLAIADVVNDDHEWLLWAAQGKIAHKAQVSRSTVVTSMAQMVTDGYLELVETVAGGVATYRFLRPCSESDTPLSEKHALPVQISKSHLLLTEVKPNAHEQAVDGHFSAFWKAYPRHADRARARTAYAKAVKKVGPIVILNGAARYRDDKNRLAEFTAHPATWLNGERWDDEPLPPRSNGKHDRTSTTPAHNSSTLKGLTG